MPRDDDRPIENDVRHMELARAKQLFDAALVHQQRGEWDRAERLYREALVFAPGRPSVLNNLAAVLLRLGKVAESESLLASLIAANPADATVILNLGNSRLERHAKEEALRLFDKALAIRPGYIDAHISRSASLVEMDRLEDALTAADTALRLDSNSTAGLCARGVCLRKLKRYEEARACYDRVLAIDQGCVDALAGLAIVLAGLQLYRDALSLCDQALRIKPDHLAALVNRGVALFGLRRFEEALAACDNVLQVRPDEIEALNNRGAALLVLKKYPAAIGTYETLLRLRPDHPHVLGHLVHAKAICCDWNGIDASTERLVSAVGQGEKATGPFPLLTACDLPALHLMCAKTHVNDNFPASPVPMCAGERYRHGRIRIAYVSADFFNHATANLMAGLFETHDKSRFEVLGISFATENLDVMSRRLAAACDRFIDVSQHSSREIAELLRRLEVDIAVDLKGFTRDARPEIFAYRAAPVQVNYLGYPGSMGADYIDYIIADRVLVSEVDERHYTERVVYLPDSYQVNDSKRRISEVTPTRAGVGLPDDAFVFCSFNNNYKITPRMLDVWTRMLRRVERSVLWLIADNPTVVVNLRREVERRGVAPERLVFASRIAQQDHLARHRLADLFLDTLPYNAHTTASDALWSGLPVLTCKGASFAGRVAASLLTAIGLTELVTYSLEQYEALACEIATTPDMLTAIKDKLAHNRLTHPLFDTDRFRMHIEAAYSTMWQRSEQGLPPVSFVVDSR